MKIVTAINVSPKRVVVSASPGHGWIHLAQVGSVNASALEQFEEELKKGILFSIDEKQVALFNQLLSPCH